MDTISTEATGTCPPHHWHIANEVTEAGSVERWTCQRCDVVRERVTARRRTLTEGRKRYIGERYQGIDALAALGGERVA